MKNEHVSKSIERQSIERLLTTEAGRARVVTALGELLHEDRKRKVQDGYVRCAAKRRGYTVDGDDLVHPTLGRFVGAARSMRANNGREAYLS